MSYKTVYLVFNLNILNTLLPHILRVPKFTFVNPCIRYTYLKYITTEAMQHL